MQAQTMIAPKRQQTTTVKMLDRSAESKGYRHKSRPDAQKTTTRSVDNVYPRVLHDMAPPAMMLLTRQNSREPFTTL
jgi:hypothetical protein